MKNTKKKCKIWWCQREHNSRGLCKKHYVSWRRTGSPIGDDVGAKGMILDRVVFAREIFSRIMSDDFTVSPTDMANIAFFLVSTDGYDGREPDNKHE